MGVLAKHLAGTASDHDQQSHAGGRGEGGSVAEQVKEAIRRSAVGRRLDVDALKIGLPPGHMDASTPQSDLARIIKEQEWGKPAPMLSDEEFAEAYATGKFTLVYRTGPIGLERGILNGTPYVGEGLFGVGTYVTDNPNGVLDYVKSETGQSVVPMLVPTAMLESAALVEPETAGGIVHPNRYLREAAALGAGALFTRDTRGGSRYASTEHVIYNTSALLVGQPSEFPDKRFPRYVYENRQETPLPWERFVKMVGGWEGSPYYSLVDGEAVLVEFDEVVKHLAGTASDHDQQSHAGGGGTDTDYRGQHTSPDRDYGAPAHDMAGFYPDDVYTPQGLRYYRQNLQTPTFDDTSPNLDGNTQTDLDRFAWQFLQDVRSTPKQMVPIYRAVPLDAPDRISPNDWVTISREYARDHGISALQESFKIVSAEVPAKDLFTNGDSWLEWGWDPKGSASPIGSTSHAVSDGVRVDVSTVTKHLSGTANDHDQQSHAGGGAGNRTELADNEIVKIVSGSTKIAEVYEKIGRALGKTLKTTVGKISDDDKVMYRGFAEPERDIAQLIEGVIPQTPMQTWGQGVYITPERDEAEGYGKVLRIGLSKNARILSGESEWAAAFEVNWPDVGNPTTSLFEFAPGKIPDDATMSDLYNVYWAGKGYDGFTPFGRETVMFNVGVLTIDERDVVSKHLAGTANDHDQQSHAGGGGTSGSTIYRGYQVNLPDDIANEIRRLTEPPTDETQIGMSTQVGPLVVRWLQENHWDADMGLGRHWSTRPVMAEAAAMQGGAAGGWNIILSAKYNTADVNPALTGTTALTAESESEVNLLPSGKVTVTDVRILGLPSNAPLLDKPIVATVGRGVAKHLAGTANDHNQQSHAGGGGSGPSISETSTENFVNFAVAMTKGSQFQVVASSEDIVDDNFILDDLSNRRAAKYSAMQMVASEMTGVSNEELISAVQVLKRATAQFQLDANFEVGALEAIAENLPGDTGVVVFFSNEMRLPYIKVYENFFRDPVKSALINATNFDPESGKVFAGELREPGIAEQINNALKQTVVSALIHEWAQSSNGTSVSILVQHAAQKEFGLDSAVTPAANSFSYDGYTESDVGALEKVARSFARAQYTATQKALSEQFPDQTHFALHRGGDQPEYYRELSGTAGKLQDATLALRPLASFSTGYSIARTFGMGSQDPTALGIETIFSAAVPKERIFSTPLTGNGALHEQEFVVLGGPITGKALFNQSLSVEWLAFSPPSAADLPFGATEFITVNGQPIPIGKSLAKPNLEESLHNEE